MEFKIMISADRPTNGDLVLESETPLSGLSFVQEVGKCLRRSIDHISRERHVTLGALSVYEMSVPQQMAIDSGLFEDKTTIAIIVENNLLSHYIFYGASVDNKASGRPCYPYMNSEATLVSYIDQLQFLEDWAAIGYPTRLVWVDGALANGEYVTTPCDKNHIGCDGCPVRHDHPHHHKPKPAPVKDDPCDLCPPGIGHNAPREPEHPQDACHIGHYPIGHTSAKPRKHPVHKGRITTIL